MTKTFEEELKEAYERASINLYGNIAGSIGMKKLLNELKEAGLLKEQQAMPVVPECVAEELKRLESTSMTTIGRIRFWTGDTVYDLDDEVAKWVGENEEIILRAMLYGYTVEKPQLFYLKHIDMSKHNDNVDYWFSKKGYEHVNTQKGFLPRNFGWLMGYGIGYLKFTQAEIDSMQTGSYEQIEVKE